MKNKIIIIVFFSFKLFGQNANIKKFDSYLPENFEVNIIVSGKFDNDVFLDYLLILNNKVENQYNHNDIRNKSILKRKVIILKGLINNKYKKIFENDDIVPYGEFCGKSDFSYSNLTLKDSVFEYSCPRSEFGQDYFELLTYKLKFENNNFKLIEFNELYTPSPENDDEIIINLSSEEIIGKNSNPFNFYNWNWCKKENLKLTKKKCNKT